MGSISSTLSTVGVICTLVGLLSVYQARQISQELSELPQPKLQVPSPTLWETLTRNWPKAEFEHDPRRERLYAKWESAVERSRWAIGFGAGLWLVGGGMRRIEARFGAESTEGG